MKTLMLSVGLGGVGLGAGFGVLRGDNWHSLLLLAGWAGLFGVVSLAWMLEGIEDRPPTVAPPNFLPGLGRP